MATGAIPLGVDSSAYIYGERVDEILAKFGEAPNEATLFKSELRQCWAHADTVHGFAARPALEHPPTIKAFHEANGLAEAFLRRTLGL